MGSWYTCPEFAALSRTGAPNQERHSIRRSIVVRLANRPDGRQALCFLTPIRSVNESYQRFRCIGYPAKRRACAFRTLGAWHHLLHMLCPMSNIHIHGLYFRFVAWILFLARSVWSTLRCSELVYSTHCTCLGPFPVSLRSRYIWPISSCLHTMRNGSEIRSPSLVWICSRSNQ